MAKIIGIDLGTTNSCVAVMEGNTPKVIENSEGARTTPSIVAYMEDGEILVGASAKRQSVTNPKNTLYAVKRLIGRKFTEKEVQKDIDLMPYKIVAADNGDAWVEVRGKKLAPPQISAEVLRKMKKTAEDYLGEPVTEAVITVPAYFNDAQRQATRDAGRLAGLEVLRLVNEPTAAALAYGLHRQQRGRVAVYDFGGGTFDISILQLIAADQGDIYRVLATCGDTHLGGDDIDARLLDLVREEIYRQWKMEVDRWPEVLQELRRAVIAAKHALSEQNATTIRLLLPDGAAYVRELTRSEFEDLIRPIVERTIGPVRQALADAGLKPSEIDEVVLVGGSTRIPLVRRRVEELFGRPPHCELNPDEVVALGAAVQADILDAGVRDTLLLDVTPLSLGIETMGGVMARLIPRNSTIPASAQELFTTGVDYQTGIEIHVLQGERELARDCRSLARFRLPVPPLPAGMARVEVRFTIDANGILQVEARDLHTGEARAVEVQPSYGLTQEEIERMLEESIEFAEQDFTERQLIEARLEAETVLRATEKSLAEPEAGELEADERQQIDEAVRALREAMRSSDYRLIRARTDALNQATQGLAERLLNRALTQALAGKRVEGT